MLHHGVSSSTRAFLALAVWACTWGDLRAHNVPSTTIEVYFKDDDTFELSVNFDPRAFLASDPRSLPPVPGSWYRDQSPEQVAATLGKAEEYIEGSVKLLFDGQPQPLPELKVQPIDGSDNTPLKKGTEELHLLATGAGPSAKDATEFRLAFDEGAAVELILLQSTEDGMEKRPQVLFPGETSRPFVLRTVPKTVAKPVDQATSPLLIVTLVVAIIAVFVGWRLLKKYRHYHRHHRKPRSSE